MLTKAGAKLLDFGLAKTCAPAIGGEPTGMVATELTAAGTLVGTVQYMAPEQLHGEPIDSRTDIFAFGTVLFEMITGKRAFQGDSAASLIAAILDREPPRTSSLQPSVPPALDRVIGACLAKDPDDRWQTMRDLRRELMWIAESGSGGDSPGAQPKTRNSVAWSVLTLALIATGAVAVIGVVSFGRPPAPEPFPTRFEIQTPATSEPVSFALSPDGRRLAFVAT